MDISVSIGRLKLQNPIMNASGTFGYGREMSEFGNISKLGAIIGKTIFVKPHNGNRPPRVAETPSGMLNAIGLENKGADDFINNKLPEMRKLASSRRKISARIIASIGGHAEKDFTELARMLGGAEGVDALEMNVSCPNVKSGGMAFSQDAKVLHKLVCAVRGKTRLPLIVKLSPNVTDIAEMARAAEDAGADAVSLVNTYKGMAVDIRTRRPLLGNVTGGLSGPAIKPLALYAVWRVAGSVKIPVIGCGGIMSIKDVLEFILVGAAAVQVGTANMVVPGLISKLPDELSKWLQSNKTTLNEFRGSLIL